MSYFSHLTKYEFDRLMDGTYLNMYVAGDGKHFHIRYVNKCFYVDGPRGECLILDNHKNDIEFDMLNANLELFAKGLRNE